MTISYTNDTRTAGNEKKFIGKLLQFDRGELNDRGFTNGYLLDYSEDWTFIQFVESDIYINGYAIIRNDTIKKYRLLDDHNHMVHRALRKLGKFPVMPKKVDMTDLNSIVQSANAIFPLIVIHREFRWKDECHIGGITAVTQKTITLTLIGTGATYDEFYRIRSSDITKIEFDGQYEKALWAVASQKTKKYIANPSPLNEFT